MITAIDRLDISRVFPGSQESLWSAWTTEEGLAKWWWSTWPDTQYSVEGKVGGGYRIDAPKNGIAVHGEYLTWTAHELLEFSWIWSDEGQDGPLEHVRVTFTPDGDETLIMLTHTGPWTTPVIAENYEQGWHHVFDSLAAAAATIE